MFKKKPPTLDGRLSHIGFIMDGNGRWATNRGLPRSMGHKAGAKAFENVLTHCREIGVKCVTVYALSTENLSRPKDELDALMDLLGDYVTRLGDRKVDNNAHVVFIGDLSILTAEFRGRIAALERDTRQFPLRLNIAVNYGGRAEIVRAANIALSAPNGAPVSSSGRRAVTEEDIDAHLYTADCPPLDLVIRTANERRLSNFLLWQAAYAEFYFTRTLWPDMKNRDVDAAVRDYLARRRKYGRI